MTKHYGIDIGTTFITVISDNEIIFRKRHKGKISSVITKVFANISKDAVVAFTGKSAKEFTDLLGDAFISETAALNLKLKNDSPFRDGTGSIVDIGASSLTKYSVINNEIINISSNSLCAAGTGLFLEEQAERLSIDLEKAPALDIDNPPNIASRCTVFAKSDIIHHQQEGRSKDEMWAGMCKALTISATNTLFRGAEVQGNIALIGGVSLNPEVVRWFKHLFPNALWIIPKNSEAFIAEGASFSAKVDKNTIDPKKIVHTTKSEKMPPLILKKSSYPEFVKPTDDDLNNEIRKHADINSFTEVIIGMDIGSTSTKIAVLSTEGKPILDIYRKTGGDPTDAGKKIFKALFRIINPEKTKILSFGTTGSGRKLNGEIFGADAIVNEITAHAKGTLFFFPDVETIFEIGGQDAKYTSIENGFVKDVNMNYVCAAGTGSFVEEQARKLDIPIQQAGKVTEGIEPPVTSDRCTVFMEQDIRFLLKQGFFKEEVLASVLYSIVKNYLNRVVGNRKISSDKVFFQGATARNKGLVAAFENLLDIEVVVSPFCHVMGCIGAALISYEKVLEKGTKSKFIGPLAANINVTSRTETCKLCNNLCRINFIKSDGGKEISWGYMCGRDPELPKRKEMEEFELFSYHKSHFFSKKKVENTGAKIGIPLALTSHSYYPLWKKLFENLNLDVVLSSPVTTAKIKGTSSKYSSSDSCFPLKTSIGHTAELLNKGIPAFMPAMIATEPVMETAISFFCPYEESAPSVIRSSLRRNGVKFLNKLIDPVIDFRLPIEKNAEYIYESMKNIIPLKKKDVVKAFKKAYEEFNDEILNRISTGEKYLKKKIEKKRPVFVLLGRPYNLYDKGINLGIPETVASMGYPVIPMDMLESEVKALEKSNYFNLFWNYGQKIIAAAKRIAKTDYVFPIYLTNFNCGPDSFILSYAEEEMKGKPMLILELDEHDSDGGYRTRIEAFIDVVESYLKNSMKTERLPIPDIFTAEKQVKKGKVWIPPMHITGTSLFAAAFRGWGYDASPLPPETKHEYNLGKRYTRGQECLPMILTLGSIMNQALKDPETQHILFMPTSEGPCRFGQYNMLERIAFENSGIKNVDILSPSSVNSYQGLEEGLRRYLMHAIMSSDLIFKLLTKTRPYEKNRGETDDLFAKSIKKLEETLENRGNPKPVIKKITEDFYNIPKYSGKKPIVGVVGEIYARSNKYANGNVIDVIEKNGGEAWLSPMHEWVLYTAWLQKYMSKQKSFKLFEAGESLIKNLYLFRTESAYYKAASKVLADREEPEVEKVLTEGMKYVPPEFAGEAILTIGRTVMFAKESAKLVVNVSPFGCMHGTITDSIFHEVQNIYGMPILSQFYDGDIDINDKVADVLSMKKDS